MRFKVANSVFADIIDDDFDGILGLGISRLETGPRYYRENPSFFEAALPFLKDPFSGLIFAGPRRFLAAILPASQPISTRES